MLACSSTPNESNSFLASETPADLPIPFRPELAQDSSIIHRGIFSNDLTSYYYTISDKVFSNFKVMVSHKQKGEWLTPEEAFFNSPYNEHGMSFSPDGKSLVFASTRPVEIEGVPDTWHIWKSQEQNKNWSEPEYVWIPGLESKLISHPTLTSNGTLYFHASDLDYSNMFIYRSNFIDGKYQAAERIEFKGLNAIGYCTPYVSADGQYMIFATIGESLELYVSQKTGTNQWSAPLRLPNVINHNGQGNPYLTPDGKYLFYASENETDQKWNVNWVSTASFLDSLASNQ